MSVIALGDGLGIFRVGCYLELWSLRSVCKKGMRLSSQVINWNIRSTLDTWPENCPDDQSEVSTPFIKHTNTSLREKKEGMWCLGYLTDLWNKYIGWIETWQQNNFFPEKMKVCHNKKGKGVISWDKRTLPIYLALVECTSKIGTVDLKMQGRQSSLGRQFIHSRGCYIISLH